VRARSRDTGRRQKKLGTKPRDRKRLPQLEGGLFLSDGGIETDLIFNDRLELPQFAAFVLLQDGPGRTALKKYYRRYAGIALAAPVGFIFESPTWRASRDWGRKLGFTERALCEANARAIGLMAELRGELESSGTPMVISGCIGPRGDGYDPGTVMSAAEAETYHASQIGVFARSEADMVTAITMTNANEAIGIARGQGPRDVAGDLLHAGNGRPLPTGQSLCEDIAQVDGATGRAPAYYMINCAHPTHFENAMPEKALWTKRVRGIRANASRRSHQELNDAPDLDDGDPVELGVEYREIPARHPQITVLGGCCGTDHRHIEQICAACIEPA